MTKDNVEKTRSRVDRVVNDYLDLQFQGAAPSAEAFIAGQPQELQNALKQRFREIETLKQVVQGVESTPSRHRIGEFKLIRKLGQGGMGQVWEAEHVPLKRRVALKILLHRPVGTVLERFQREAQTIGRLDHPALVKIYSVHQDGSRAMLAMELVRDGKTLADFIAEQRQRTELPSSYFRIVAELFRQLAEGLAEVHQKGILHRDVKPGNILLTPALHPKLVDFGLARTLLDPRLTATGAVVGTPHYLNPEQCSLTSLPIDGRSDIFSLGTTLYESLTLTRAFPGETREQVMEKIIRHDPPDPRTIHHRVPRDLAVICMKSLEKQPDKRYASMIELAEDLRRHQHHEAILAKPAGWPARSKKWVRRHPIWSIAGTVTAISLLVVGILLIRTWALNQEFRALESLRYVPVLDNLTSEAQALWPPTPEMVPKYQRWLNDWEQLQDLANDLENTLLWLEQQAEHWTENEQWVFEQDERHEKLRNMEREREYWQRNLHFLQYGKDPDWFDPEQFPMPSSQISASHDSLQRQAWSYVGPMRKVYGRESFGLDMMQHLFSQQSFVPSNDTFTIYSWALFDNGFLDESLDASRQALEMAPESEKPNFLDNLKIMERNVAELRTDLGIQDRKRRIAVLNKQISKERFHLEHYRPWKFSDSLHRHWHDRLARVILDLRQFNDPEDGLASGTSKEYGWGIQRRLEFASKVRAMTLTDRKAKLAWETVFKEISAAPPNSPYKGLPLKPQLGLFPIGRDLKSGLFEFAHPLTGDIPDRNPTTGELELTETTGLIFVLIPGGSFVMGGQKEDLDEPGFDPLISSNENLQHEVSLDPFFLSKFEMTQSQWEYFCGHNPSFYNPSFQGFGNNRGSRRNPVEQVSWRLVQEVLARSGLELPTEAQWEYAARGGLDHVWGTVSDAAELDRFANLADAFAKESGHMNTLKFDSRLHDGWVSHAPVGSFLANGYGLHDMHGNVSEWCQDLFLHYSREAAPGNGLRKPFPKNNPENRIIRGGGFGSTPKQARTRYRYPRLPGFCSGDLGLRPMRPLE